MFTRCVTVVICTACVLVGLTALGMAGGAVYWMAGCLDTVHDPEVDVETLESPDGGFSVVVTLTRETWPYGVEGNVYLIVEGSSQRMHVTGYSADDTAEAIGYLEWSDEQNGFVWAGRIFINPRPSKASTPSEQ